MNLNHNFPANKSYLGETLSGVNFHMSENKLLRYKLTRKNSKLDPTEDIEDTIDIPQPQTTPAASGQLNKKTL